MTNNCSCPPPSGSGTTPVLPLLILVLVVLVIGAGLLYLTIAHPALAVPLTVAVGGVALIVTLVGVVVGFISTSRR
ncbi:hypothetical protein OG974_30180 (plasmid) [Streptomyces sp. NBC_00597]|uniref:hypothetical protein n=1 Tax=unclassified Streptomyces TaxID=2593676 RepID=UPI002E1120F9|nr:hypothetical protein OG573_40180 [Streptomyces sp. NBC_01205]